MNDAGRFLIIWSGCGIVVITLIRLIYEGWAPHLLDRDPRARPVSSAMCCALGVVFMVGVILASY